MYTYNTIRRMSKEEVYERLSGHICLDEENGICADLGAAKRLLGRLEIEEKWIDRTVPAKSSVAIYNILGGFEVGYRTSGDNVLSYTIDAYMMHRDVVPLLTEWEQVSMCDNIITCRGSSGGCPGFAPRFTDIRRKSKTFVVITVTMDMKWALLYAGKRNWMMRLVWADRLSRAYCVRLLKRIKELGYVTQVFSLGSCSGRCRNCAVMEGAGCSKPDAIRYSMESVGIDCDMLHNILYGEWLPWGYDGMNALPTTMVRYIGFLYDDDADYRSTETIYAVGDCILGCAKTDASYCNVREVPYYIAPNEVRECAVPTGVHTGTVRKFYML